MVTRKPNVTDISTGGAGYKTLLLAVYKTSLFFGGSEVAGYKTSLFFRSSKVAVYKNLQKVFPDLIDYKTSLNF